MEDMDQWKPRTLAHLQKLPYDELVRLHDKASRDWVDWEYFLAEIRYRQQDRLTRKMVRLTVVITILTGLVTFATLYNVFWN